MTQSPTFLSRRAFVTCLGAGGVMLLPGCSSSLPHRAPRLPASPPAPVDQSLARSGKFLASRQSPDGAWRSDVYGFFRDGPTLTPHVSMAVAALAKTETELMPVMEKAADYLARQVDEQGNVQSDLIYPAYIAADASRVLLPAGPTPARQKARDRWLRYLWRHQLAEPLGWGSADVDYGGWGYAPQPPRKAPAGDFRGPWDWSNLSATVYALDALPSAGTPTDDPVCVKAFRFVQRCQNFSEDDLRDATPPPATDGGFFFGPSASIRNKAGTSTGADGREYYNSYGSTTCDSLRALLGCGLPHDHPRVVAAQAWIERNFSVQHHPGRFVAANEDLRDATYYYYVHSLSLVSLQSPPSRIDWAATLAAELMNRQRPDGSWANQFTDGKEDDTLVATPFATLALANCR